MFVCCIEHVFNSAHFAANSATLWSVKFSSSSLSLTEKEFSHSYPVYKTKFNICILCLTFQCMILSSILHIHTLTGADQINEIL